MNNFCVSDIQRFIGLKPAFLRRFPTQSRLKPCKGVSLYTIYPSMKVGRKQLESLGYPTVKT